MPQKSELTQRLVSLLPDQERISLERASRTWYYNLNANRGLRLTQEGWRIMSDVLELENWCYPVAEPKTITKRILLDMDRKIQYPYFLTKGFKGVIFFSSREAMMATMYGDLRRWLENHG